MRLLPSRIGLRYSYARRGSQFIGLSSVLAVIGITIGIAALIVVLSVMNGVVTEVRDKMLSMTAHVSIRPSAADTIEPDFNPAIYLDSLKSVIAYAPYVQGQGLIGDGDRFQGVLIQGINPKEQGKVSQAFANIDEEVKAKLLPGGYNIILGHALAKQLNVQNGDKITVIVPKINASAAGLLPRIKRFTLIGTFISGHSQFDSQVAIVASEDATKLLQLPGGFSGYQIMLDDPLKAPFIRDQLNNGQMPWYVYASDWSLDQSAYFNAVQMEKNAMFIILSLIIIVAAFGLLSSMYMVVTEKRRDIAILRTMGLTRAQIRQIFLTQGMIFGGLGTILGILLGVIISLNIPAIMSFLEKHTGYQLPAELYFVSELTAKIDPMVITGVTIVTLLLTLIFSVIPAQIAAKTEPARALAYE
ncbi:MAG: lipoprotein-releasing system transmembrane subunit LolC [Cardiobacteriales bacterium]|nr:MAG: lipoprotein-releasing system transmembrane subunit LolC [Cardiobacteriales bacterium]